ncbi:hypothetical protein MKW92_047698 [Papaver armeniacum]|nr:hypothetical protein MKW92_047698 [Papaver armeniacum]
MKNLKHHKNEDILKGQVVKNQKVLWDKTLEFRFLLQKPFSSSNKLPKEPLRSSFCDSEKATNKAYLDLITSSEQTINCLLELQEALLEKSPHVAQNTDGNTKESSKEAKQSKSLDASIDKEWLPIQQMHSSISETQFVSSSFDLSLLTLQGILFLKSRSWDFLYMFWGSGDCLEIEIISVFFKSELVGTLII